ncbi:MAG: hypothetical protein JSS09_07645 [Verrucomicrobia bacterium]|nr:hypothetical protein [Verrucomicrobiota bacterium]
MSNQASLDPDLIEKLHVEEQTILLTIKNILSHQSLIEDLYQEYIDLLKTSERSCDFYIPNSPSTPES